MINAAVHHNPLVVEQFVLTTISPYLIEMLRFKKEREIDLGTYSLTLLTHSPLTHSLTHLTHSLTTYSPLTHSPYSLTHLLLTHLLLTHLLLTHLTHSLTSYSLTHSLTLLTHLTYSLTHSYLGAFKEKFDDGLPLRKLSLTCIDTILDTYPDLLDIMGFVQCLSALLEDKDEIKTQTHQVIQKIIPRFSNAVIRYLTHSLSHLLTHSLTHSLAHSVTHLLTHSLTYLLTHLLTHLLILTYSSTHSLTHLLTHSLLLTPLQVCWRR